MTWLRRLILSFSCLLAFACSDSTEPGDRPPSDPEGNETPPAFEGVTSADLLEDGGVLLTWEDSAEDDETPQERIVYSAYVGKPGKVDFSRAVAVSPAGADRVVAYGLAQSQEYEFVVRALDDAGNESDTTRSVKLHVPDLSIPQFAGVRGVEALSGSELEVSWALSPNSELFEHFLVYISPVPLLPFDEEPLEVSGEETSFIVSGLEEARAYNVAVRAVNERGVSDRNQRYLEGRTLDVSPPAFLGLDRAVAGGTAVRLTWTPAEDNVTPSSDIVYRIFQGETPESIDYSTPRTEVTGISTFVLSGLDLSTDYSFDMRAVDAAGNESNTSNVLSLVTGAEADVTPPIFAGATGAITLGASSISVLWDAATDDLTPQEDIVYDIWVSAEEIFPDTTEPNRTSPPGATSFDVTGLQPSTLYNVLVRARDIEGLRDDNTVVHTTKTKADDTPPVFAGVTSVVGTSVTSLQVNWEAATDASPASSLEYRVYLATSSGGQNFAVPSQTVVGLLSASFDGLARGTPYYAVVQVIDPDGNLNESMVEVSGATLPDTTAPVLATGPSLNAASETAISVSWTAATDDSFPTSELQYQVQYRRAGVGDFVDFGGLISGAGPLSTTITGLLLGTSYEVRVIPRDGVPNIGAASPVGTVFTSNDTTPPTFNVTPTLSASTYLSGSYFNQVTVSWTPASDNISAPGNIFYEVCYSTASSGCDTFSVLATTAAGVTNITLSGFPWGSPYHFRIRAVDQAGNRTMSNVATDTTPPNAFAAPTLVFSGTQVTVTNPGATDSVFTNLRYRVEYWAGTPNTTTCSSNWLAFVTTGVTSGGTSSSVPRLFGDNYVQVVAIDGFGNERFSSGPSGAWTTLSDSTAAAANAVIPPLWNANCQGSGCHGGTGGSFSAWNMTTVFQAPSPVGGAGAVIVANDLNSRMYRRVTGQLGSLMPVGALVPVNSIVCNLQRWILAGAPK